MIAWMKITIMFPAGAPYGQALGSLRKALKPYLRDLPVRKRAAGAVITGPSGKVASALLILPDGFVISAVSE